MLVNKRGRRLDHKPQNGILLVVLTPKSTFSIFNYIQTKNILKQSATICKITMTE
jgi:hypothetical protein